MAVVFGHEDPTSCVLRDDRTDVIYGAEEALTFLDEHLVHRETYNDYLLPGKRVAMLYGREGSGKTSLLHAHDRKYHKNDALGFIHHFRVQHWNMPAFKDWAVARVRDLNLMAEAPDRRRDYMTAPPGGMTLIIAGLHRFNRAHDHDDAFTALLHLLARVQAFMPSTRIRVLLLCDESPGHFPSELLSLIDKMHLLVPINPEGRRYLLWNLMDAFRGTIDIRRELTLVGWDLDLVQANIDEDISHILHTLVVASSGCTPREILNFMRRTFAGCSKPKDDGTTVYNAAWIESLLYKIDGSRPCITPSNPVSLNAPCFTYAGVGSNESIMGPTSKTCFVRDVPLIFNPNAGDNAAPDDDEMGANNGKRARIELQPKTVTDSLNARLAQQADVLATSARNAKRLRGKDGDHE